MIISKTDTILSNRCKLPTDRYRVIIKKSEFVTSNNKGNPMTTLSCEILEPETIEVNGETFKIAGRPFKMYLLHGPEEWGQAKTFRVTERLGLQLDQYDTELHKAYFDGVEFDMVLSSEEDIKRRTPLPGQKEGEPILDGAGKPITNGWRINANADDICEYCNPVRPN